MCPSARAVLLRCSGLDNMSYALAYANTLRSASVLGTDLRCWWIRPGAMPRNARAAGPAPQNLSMSRRVGDISRPSRHELGGQINMRFTAIDPRSLNEQHSQFSLALQARRLGSTLDCLFHLSRIVHSSACS